MKLLFLLFVVLLIAIAVYFLTSKWSYHLKKNNWKPLGITTVVVFALLGLIAFGIYSSSKQPDIQCASLHATKSKAPVSLKTAMDYFAKGNYSYDLGDCNQAIIDYTKAIALNPEFSQAYNNRAYTYMRLRNYKSALPDLDKAIQLNPNYVQALMNRGDIHNYYYQINRQAAILDYNKVISITGKDRNKTSVCGHLFLAKHNGWTLGAYLDFFTGALNHGCQ